MAEDNNQFLNMQRMAAMGGNIDPTQSEIGACSVLNALLPNLGNMGAGARGLLDQPLNVFGAGFNSMIIPHNGDKGIDAFGLWAKISKCLTREIPQGMVDGVGGNVHQDTGSSFGSGPSGLQEATIDQIKVQDTPIADARIASTQIG